VHHEPPRDLTHDRGVGIERADDAKALRLETGVADDRATESADAHDRHVPRLVEPENIPETLKQVRDGITPALLAEATEIAEVLADLGRGDLEELTELL